MQHGEHRSKAKASLAVQLDGEIADRRCHENLQERIDDHLENRPVKPRKDLMQRRVNGSKKHTAHQQRSMRRLALSKRSQ